jgi:hypothetical protein
LPHISARPIAAVQSRVLFSKLSIVWRSMSLADRLTFSSFASTYPTFDKFGNPVVLTGYQLFIMLNRSLQLIGVSPVTECIAYSVPPLSDFDFDEINVTTQSAPLLFNTQLVSPYVALFYTSNCVIAGQDQTDPAVSFRTWINWNTALNFNMYSALVSSMAIKPFAGGAIYWSAVIINYLTGALIADNSGYRLIDS